MTAKISASFFGIAVFCTVIVSAAALTKPEVKGFNERLFQYHLDRADREWELSSWMKEARQGLEIVLADWERTALELYGDPEFLPELKKEITLWSEEALERRFSEWLFKRFFGEYSGAVSRSLAEAVEEANRIYAYHTGDDGEISYGETGDPETIRPAEGRSVEEDRDAWLELTRKTSEGELARYKSTIASLCPEILSYISGENRSAFEARLASLVEEDLSKRKAEFNAVLSREARLFIARRTGDLWSLRKQSENESAQMISARLIQDAAAQSSSALALLEKRIEAAKNGSGDLALMGAEWLAAFEEQFDRGLNAWTRAEEDFLIRRIEWERDSGELFLSGEEAWRSAFAEMEKERIAWEEKAKELFESGEKLFAGVSQLLERSIAEAKAEFENDAALRSAAGADRARAWVDIYVTCGSVLAEAKENIAFWLSRFPGEGTPALGSGAFESWVRGILDGSSNQNTQNDQNNPDNQNKPVLTANQITAGNELLRWSSIYNQYLGKLEEARETLGREFGLALGLDAGALNSVLGKDSEAFHLDEYQVELLRAQAAASYWSERLAAAEAVSAYAADLSAGRMTEAESLVRWRESKAAYDAALEAYASVQERLSAAGLNLALVRDVMIGAADALEQAERTLEELNSQYALKMAAYRVQSKDFILNELANYYAALSDLSERRRNDDSYYTAYLSAARRYSIENGLSRGWVELEGIAGSPDDEWRNIRLALLHGSSAQDWYFAVTGVEADTQALSHLEDEGVYRRLKQDALESGGEREFMLLYIYRELAEYAPAVMEETAASFIRALAGIFYDYGITRTGAYLPSPQSFAASLLQYCASTGEEPGTALAELFVRIDQEAELVPDWIAGELESWKDAFLMYTALYAKQRGNKIPGNAGQIKEKYDELTDYIWSLSDISELTEDLIRELSYYQYLSLYIDYFAAEGTETIADHAEDAGKRLNGGLKIFAEGDLTPSQSTFMEAAGTYLEDPGKAFENFFDPDTLPVLYELYKTEAEKLAGLSSEERYYASEIARLSYVIIDEGLEEGMQNISAALDAMRGEYQGLLTLYNTRTEQFASAALYYESLYSETKQLFNAVEKARLSYEKEDAIRRWASTAYLGEGSGGGTDTLYYKEPAEELAYAKERSERARFALEALKDLYNGNESKRPYDDPEYKRLYEEYRESFARMLLTLKARQETERALSEEKARNAGLENSLLTQTPPFLNPLLPEIYEQYQIPAFAAAGWQDFLGINEKGRLVVSYDRGNFRLNQLSNGGAAALADYFRNDGGGLSLFQNDLIQWSVRMASYDLQETANYQRWGLALDYLIRQLLENNQGRSIGGYTLTEMGEDGNMKLSGNSLNALLAGYRTGDLKNIQRNAWDSLSEQEKEDLEFLLALLLTGGGGEGSSGLTMVSESRELQWLYDKANSYRAKNKVGGFLGFILTGIPFFLLGEDASQINQVKNAVNNRRTGYNLLIESNKNAFQRGLTDLSQTGLAYQASCENLTKLSAEKTGEGKIEWDDLEAALGVSGSFNGTEIERLESYWNEMTVFNAQNGLSRVFNNVPSALESLMLWARGMRNAAKEEFEAAYVSDKENGLEAQEKYRRVFNNFINGSGNLNELKQAASAAYGNASAARKNHLENLGNTMLEDLGGVSTYDSGYAQVFRELAEEYTSLIERTYAARYEMENAAREAGWNEQRRDLNEKILAWKEASALILERGRVGWKSGAEALRSGYARWLEDFEEEYELISAAWDAAYYESLKNKEAWVNRAVEAADSAYSGAVLSFIGSDAEMESRMLDVFLPSSLPGFGGKEEASSALRAALEAAGIKNLSNAISALSGSAETVLTQVRGGAGILGLWNAGRAAASAKELAAQSTAALASGKMAILAVQARETALMAKKSLEEMIEFYNRNFDDAMDGRFTLDGGWARSGSHYVRDIIVHSTFFTGAITDRVVVEAYKWYVMNYWELTTRLDDAYLEGLDYSGIQGLIGLVQSEIQAKSEEIFGNGVSEGLFSGWIGKEPVISNGNISGGSGELGRLLREYYSWSIKQAQGIALMNTPGWEKPLWDSRGSVFAAPSLRTVADIGIAVVATVASVYTGGASLGLLALTMVDDAIFTAADLAGGYKTWDEAGFAFGQKALMSAATMYIGSAFQGLQGTLTAAVSGTKSVIDQTMLSGAQALSIGTVNAFIGSVTYNSRDGFGWSNEAFLQGIRGGLVSAAVGMTDTFTSGTLGLINSGSGLEKLEGFSNLNKMNVASLNKTLGGLAGQGVNYALTGDFALNVLNVFNTGLLELHFGDQGFGMNLGTGGTDLSYGAIKSALEGAAVWGTNSMIGSYTNTGNLDIAIALRSLYGFGDDKQKRQLRDILAGRTEIRISNDEDGYDALSVDNAGSKVIYLGRYKEGMTVSEQLRLGAILGQEAYRDGIADGNFDEFRTANIARILMSNRINEDYSWFYEENADFGQDLLSRPELFDAYLMEYFNNGEDYYWKWIKSDGDFQNSNKGDKNIPLLAGWTKEEVDAINRGRLDSAVAKYKQNYDPGDLTDEAIKSLILDDKKLQKDLGYFEESYYSLYDHGCMLFSAMYIAETLVGSNLDPVKVNAYIKELGLYTQGSALSNKLLEDVIYELTNHEYKIKLVDRKGLPVVPALDELYKYEMSKDMYFSHIRVNYDSRVPNNKSTRIHSETVAGIVYDLVGGYRTGINHIETANSWNGNGGSLISQTKITTSSIVRWDVYKGTPTTIRTWLNNQKGKRTANGAIDKI
ncbi:MAG: hypothetical protein LBQ67_00775 [Treponema sp.]|jgi:hypothetical protein|nr:hypothetical protein [Treponema sp.]